MNARLSNLGTCQTIWFFNLWPIFVPSFFTFFLKKYFYDVKDFLTSHLLRADSGAAPFMCVCGVCCKYMWSSWLRDPWRWDARRLCGGTFMQTGDEHDGHHTKGVFEEQKNTECIKPPCERVILNTCIPGRKYSIQCKRREHERRQREHKSRQ
jgi:hypothetical protein